MTQRQEAGAKAIPWGFENRPFFVNFYLLSPFIGKNAIKEKRHGTYILFLAFLVPPVCLIFISFPFIFLPKVSHKVIMLQIVSGPIQ